MYYTNAHLWPQLDIIMISIEYVVYLSVNFFTSFPQQQQIVEFIFITEEYKLTLVKS